MSSPLAGAVPPMLVYVVGPSGAGKDSLLGWLAGHWPTAPGWPALHVARRTITRPWEKGGEPHEAVSPAEFALLQASGQFALDWQANRLHYGIRTTELTPSALGLCVLVNGSRAHVAEVVNRYPSLVVLHISAPPSLLLERLQHRQRETGADIQARLARNATLPSAQHQHPGRWLEITNAGCLADAGAQALAALQPLLQCTNATQA